MNCCPACGGEPTFLGTLGTVDNFRCRACGWDWQELAEESEEDTEEEDDGQPDEMQEWHDFDPDC